MIEGPGLPMIPAGRVRLRTLADGDAPVLDAVFSEEILIRYWRRPPMRFVAEAHTALIGFARGPLGLLRLEADVGPRNALSVGIVSASASCGKGCCGGAAGAC